MNNFTFDELPAKFGMEWRLLLIPQNVFMDDKFKGNMMGKLKNSFKFADFFDQMLNGIYENMDLNGKKMRQEMGTQRQIRNLFFVCRLMTVATYLNKQKELSKNNHFKSALGAMFQWEKEKKSQELSGANHVVVVKQSFQLLLMLFLVAASQSDR
jgi:hypothetical protein